MIMTVAQDVTDPQSEKSAFQFLTRSISVWAQPTHCSNGVSSADAIPGFERFVYEHVFPLAFKVPSLPEFNIKDGQMVTVSSSYYSVVQHCSHFLPQVCHEIAGMIQAICQTRGKEAYDYLADVFFPSVHCPPATALEFLTAAKDLDSKAFRKYFTDFVRASNRPTSS
jgi:exportin-T